LNFNITKTFIFIIFIERREHAGAPAAGHIYVGVDVFQKKKKEKKKKKKNPRNLSLEPLDARDVRGLAREQRRRPVALVKRRGAHELGVYADLVAAAAGPVADPRAHKAHGDAQRDPRRHKDEQPQNGHHHSEQRVDNHGKHQPGKNFRGRGPTLAQFFFVLFCFVFLWGEPLKQ
jgi:hypothetical protein